MDKRSKTDRELEIIAADKYSTFYVSMSGNGLVEGEEDWPSHVVFCHSNHIGYFIEQLAREKFPESNFSWDIGDGTYFSEKSDVRINYACGDGSIPPDTIIVVR